MKIFFLIILLIIALPSYSAEVSITIDDPGVQQTSAISYIQVGERIREALKQHNLKSTLFVCGMRIDNHDGKLILKDWDQAGHILANHTYSHKNYNNNDIDFQFYSEDILKNENLIQSYKNFKRIFRYPMLKEGNTTLKRDQLRAFLKDKNYSLGHVTIDASDWYISNRMVEKLNKNEKINFEAYKNYYLGHIWDRAQYYNKLSKEVLGREVKHSLLIHHNVLNAYFLNDLIQMFKSKGWKVINSEEAMKDPAYLIPTKNIPAGESLLWALAKENEKYKLSLRYPAEDGVYQKDEMDRLGL